MQFIYLIVCHFECSVYILIAFLWPLKLDVMKYTCARGVFDFDWAEFRGAPRGGEYTEESGVYGVRERSEANGTPDKKRCALQRE